MPRYRVLLGIHYHEGTPYYRGGPDGDIVDTETNLLRHNPARRSGLPPKFELVEEDEEQPAPPEEQETPNRPPPWANLTVLQLREFAENQEIDLGTAVRKDEILQTISEAMAAR